VPPRMPMFFIAVLLLFRVHTELRESTRQKAPRAALLPEDSFTAFS